MPARSGIARWGVIAAALVTAAVVVGAAGPSSASSQEAELAGHSKFTVSVSPDHGQRGSTVTATLSMSPGPCAGVNVGFYLAGSVQAGRELAPLVTMPASCTARTTITVPTSWSNGAKHIYGTYGDPEVPPGEHNATFVVTPNPEPSPSLGTQNPPSPTASSGGRNLARLTPGPKIAPTTAPATVPAGASGTATTTETDVEYTPPTDQATGGHQAERISPFTYAWVGLSVITIAGLVGAMFLRRRLAATEGRHRQEQ